MEQKQTITLVVKNHPGVLLRITGLFTRRGFNIRQVNKVQEVVASDLKAGEA